MDNEVNVIPKPTKRRLPILGRHAISLAVVFALAIPASYYVGLLIFQNIQLGKLLQEDEEKFEEGLSYVYANAGKSGSVSKFATQNLAALPPDRAGRVLVALCMAESKANGGRTTSFSFFGEIAERSTNQQAIGLYDQLLVIPGIDQNALGQALLDQIKIAEDESAVETVALLEQRLLWSEEQVPTAKWLNWLSVLAESDAELTQHQAARRLGELPDHVDEQQIKQALARLAKSKHDSVRAMVLNACAGYAGIAEDPTDYEQIIFDLGNDKNKVIARRAWMIVGHLNPLSGYAVNWKEADPFVAEAMLWAAVKGNPENPKPALDALAKQESTNQALMALGESPMAIWKDLRVKEDFEHAFDFDLMVFEEDAISIWRSLLALNFEAGSPFPDISPDYLRLVEEPAALVFYLDDKEVYRARQYDLSISLSASFRSGMQYPFAKDENKALMDLAATEGWAMLHMARKIPPHFPQPKSPFARLVAIATGAHLYAPQDLVGQIDIAEDYFANLMVLALIHDRHKISHLWLRSGLQPLKYTAILATGIIGDRPELINGITADFLRRNPDINTGELDDMPQDALAEIGLERVDAMSALLKAASSAPPSAGRQTEVKLLKLALWMRGDLGEDFTPTAEGMLFDEDLATSTVLMCLLHMKRPIALEYLFGDLVQPRPDLHELFVQERYWHVFRRFVDTSDLTLWLWGDPDAQAFQLEAMRQWYAVNRWRIEGGWWPTLEMEPAP